MKTITDLWNEAGNHCSNIEYRLALTQSAVELEKAHANELLAHAIAALIEKLENK
jgi:SMC interacting uncharacterized protein involved in chromosome segregation